MQCNGCGCDRRPHAQVAHGDSDVDAASRALAQRTWPALKRSTKAGVRRTVRHSTGLRVWGLGLVLAQRTWPALRRSTKAGMRRTVRHPQQGSGSRVCAGAAHLACAEALC